MKGKKNLLSVMMMALLALGWQSCKKSDNNSTSTSGDMVLSIQTGARSTSPDGNISYSAVLVDKNGATSTPSSVSWSVSASGGGSLGSFSGSGASVTFDPSAVGYGTITASATVNGKTYTAKVPINVYTPGLFTVVPSAVIWTTNAGTIDLNPVYIGTETTTYSYQSTDESVATVSSTGEITFKKTGECAIKVTANGLSGSPYVYVPVLVTGMPEVALPVVRVAVNPPSSELFRTQTVDLTAKAYNSGGSETSATFTWASSDPSIATVSNTGKVTALGLGHAVVTATTNGIVGQTEIEVLPDTAIILTPYLVNIAAGANYQMTAKTYKVDRSTRAVTEITNPALTWTIPTYGIPVFDIASVNASGKVTMNTSATPGMMTFVVAEAASPTVQPGVATIMVSDCDCGATTPGVTQIGLTSPSTVNISIMGGATADIVAQAQDATGAPVSGATLHYCSSSMTVCTVDDAGTITGVAPGTATITICNGSVSRTITVNVSF